jgi:hypothetical protein
MLYIISMLYDVMAVRRMFRYLFMGLQILKQVYHVFYLHISYFFSVWDGRGI